MKSNKIQLGVLVLLIAVLGGLASQHQAVQDWFRLRDYTPPSSVAELATQDDMTPIARHLFYVNRPSITNGMEFTKNCPAGTEKTVVLGCYRGNDAGIYIYDVKDARLSGVEQVTAAHEMLHAAYRRLSTGERTTVDAMLVDYYNHDLSDQRIKDTIAAYKTAEPHDVVNEMHSVFGTEATNLPPKLEAYYQRYFTNRATVTAYTASYEAEFSSRESQVAQDDAQLVTYQTQLDSWRQQITANNAQLTKQSASLDAQEAQLTTDRAAGDATAYDATAAQYNRAVGTYQTLVSTTHTLVIQYNGLVETAKTLLAARNALVLEEQQLKQALSATPIATN